MIRTAYFDRNVFDHIRKRQGITDSDVRGLEHAVDKDRISVLLSVSLVEETLILVKESPNTAREEGQLLARLTRGSEVIKPHQELLRDDIFAYAKGLLSPEPFTTEFTDLAKYLNPDEPDLPGHLVVAEQVQQAKIEVHAELIGATNNDSVYFKLRPKSARPRFKEYYKDYSVQVAADLAEAVGVLAECKAKGLDGLLQVRSVQLCVGAQLSLSFAQTREGQSVSLGDWHDMQHAVLASAADAFVTEDHKLAKNLNRIGIADFQVINLGTFLQRIR